MNFSPVEFLLKNLLFVLFLGFLAMTYIANAHYAEKNIRNIQLMRQEIKELRWSYMSLESENMVNSMKSVVEDKIKEEGIQLRRGKIYKIEL